MRAAPFAVFEDGAGEQRARARPVVRCIGVAPEIRGSPKTLDGARAVAVGEKHRALGAVRGRQDRRAREHRREFGEFDDGGPRRRDVVVGEGDLDLGGEQSGAGEVVARTNGLIPRSFA